VVVWWDEVVKLGSGAENFISSFLVERVRSLLTNFPAWVFPCESVWHWQTAGRRKKKWLGGRKMREFSRDKKPALHRRAFLVEWRGGKRRFGQGNG